MELKVPYKDKVALSYSLMRTAHFTAQQLSLPLFDFLRTGKVTKKAAPEHLPAMLRSLYELLKKDAENINKGLYPLEVLKPEKPGTHFLRYPQIIWDGFQIARRRDDRNQTDFNLEARQYLSEVPEYYRRNFHFQSGGYLTRKSAELYEHQVEILFAGAGDAMRRLLLPMMKKHWSGDGDGLHFLELGVGTGRMTRFVKLAYPKARITVMDLSYPYLQVAQRKLKNFDRLDFVQGAAEEIPFTEGRFDGVYSCFLYHELPRSIRQKNLEEIMRVLKPGGLVGIVDSLQNEDAQELGWALQQFPVDFHEPFYKNYVENPMEGLLQKAGFQGIEKDCGFFAKALLAKKPF